jgi:putative MATE family efflux protein
LLDAPLPWLLVRLALPNLTPFAAIFILVSVDAMVVGTLGREALAGLSLVFPIVMLSQTMAAGGLGSAVASAVARALGRGDRERARRLALHGMLVALLVGGCFTVIVVGAARPLFSLMGGRGDVLDHAVSYATVVFLGAAGPWLLNVTASISRGLGDMKRPALVLGLTAVVYLVLSPVLTLGLGPFRGLAIVGTGLAFVASYALGTVVNLWVLLARDAPLRLRLRDFTFDRSALREILTVGALGGANAVVSSLTALVATGFVGHLGPASLAGYGLGSRLEYLVIPLSFAVGTALVTVVGANVGAGNVDRARRAAWIGAGLAGLATGIVGAVVSIDPDLWLGLFTSDAGVLDAGAVYLRAVGPSYGFFGLGLALYFASIGAGRPALPVLASGLRLAMVAVGLSLTMPSFSGACAAIAVAFTTYGIAVALGTKLTSWRPAEVR